MSQEKTYLGIELGSTRIKAVLIDGRHALLASGSHDWENRFDEGVWTYALDDVWKGVQDSVRALKQDLAQRYADAADRFAVDAIGISAMMHGYLVFDADEKQLVPFRTWRNTMTERATDILTEAFSFNIPQRWNIAHHYQAILNGEPHVRDIAFSTTLAGYVHWKLTGERVLGIGDASGMFPIDSIAKDYDAAMMARFDELIAGEGFDWRLKDILPRVLCAGDAAGTLTAEGAKCLDPEGWLQPGIALCPPEGDAGTGMTATNSVAERTGNISAGTSIFAMVVLERGLSAVYREIDMVTTPSGRPTAMVHCNNCTSDSDAWVGVFGEAIELFGVHPDKGELYGALYNKALAGEADGGGLLTYNYYSGEPITGFEEGRPLLTRLPDSRFTLANLMRSILFSTMATLKIGMDILTEKERAQVDRFLGHGGFFKTEGVGQRLMASALGIPVAVMPSAGEGGAWGIALLAAYMANRGDAETLEGYLENRVFAENAGICLDPDQADAAGFAAFMERYQNGLNIERAAVDHLK
jgi:sugar (pentulose or hexulose) kinase